MATIDLKNKSVQDLMKDMHEAAAELQKSRFIVAGTKNLKVNPSKLRKTIARIHTELRARNK